MRHTGDIHIRTLAHHAAMINKNAIVGTVILGFHDDERIGQVVGRFDTRKEGGLDRHSAGDDFHALSIGPLRLGLGPEDHHVKTTVHTLARRQTKPAGSGGEPVAYRRIALTAGCKQYQ